MKNENRNRAQRDGLTDCYPNHPRQIALIVQILSMLTLPFLALQSGCSNYLEQSDSFCAIRVIGGKYKPLPFFQPSFLV
jgi:hypothetical protein